MGKFAGEIAIVTAAAGAGIGQATARALAQEGATVVVSDIHPKRTIAVAEEIASAYKTPTLAIVCDVTDRQQVDNMVQDTMKKFGKIDIVINNAGFDLAIPLAEMDIETLTRIVNINFMGTLYVAKAVLPPMIKQAKGSIVNLASIAAFTPDAKDSVVYCASKAGIVALTRTLAREVGKYNIRVNAVAPAVVMNPFLEKVMPREELEEIKKRFMTLDRDSTPEDIAKTIMFLVSDEASLISGETVRVTGAW